MKTLKTGWTKRVDWLKVADVTVTVGSVAALCLIPDVLAFAAKDIGTVAGGIADKMAGVGKLLGTGAQLGGAGMAAGSAVKFKAHRDNPQQVPLGTPIVMLAVGAALFGLPMLLGTGVQTMWDGTGTSTFGDIGIKAE